MAENANGNGSAGELQKTMKALLLAQIGGWKRREQIQLLDRAGLGQSKIALMLGTTSKAASVLLAEIRRKARTERR